MIGAEGNELANFEESSRKEEKGENEISLTCPWGSKYCNYRIFTNEKKNTDGILSRS